MPDVARQIVLRPTGLFDEKIEDDPNINNPSYVQAGLPADFRTLGIQDWILARGPTGRLSNTYFYSYENERDWSIIYFDEKTGLIVHRTAYIERRVDRPVQRKQTVLFAGPKGVSDSADKALGRFADPLVNFQREWNLYPEIFVYDKKLRCFFALDFRDQIVRKGPQLRKCDPHHPTKVHRVRKNWSYSPFSFSPPRVKVPVSTDANESEESQGRTTTKPTFKSAIEGFGIDHSGRYVLVLDESGRIDLLDKQTLEFAGPAGFLPAPRTLFDSKDPATPPDLLAYDVFPCAFVREDRYLGMCVATVARQGTTMALAVFNEKGNAVKNADTMVSARARLSIPSSKAVYFSSPGAPGLTVAKYLLENLQPPILSAASYLTADSFEAGSGHRALFILPNSFIAMQASKVTDEVINKYLFAVMLILPSLILAALLAWRVHSNAVLVGLSQRARFSWVLVTIAFGLSAYITYRLTRPKITLVTCANCGKPRRPDMETCHRCGSKWVVAELTPPTWRVVDEKA
jgi:hypothetical protein